AGRHRRLQDRRVERRNGRSACGARRSLSAGQGSHGRTRRGRSRAGARSHVVRRETTPRAAGRALASGEQRTEGTETTVRQREAEKQRKQSEPANRLSVPLSSLLSPFLC